MYGHMNVKFERQTTEDSQVNTAPANTDYRYTWPVGHNNPALHDHRLPHMELLTLYTPITEDTATCIYNIVTFTAITSTMKMEAEGSPETLVFTFWCHNPGGDNLNLQEGFHS